MALTTIVPTLKRAATMPASPTDNSVCTKTISFNVLTGATGNGYESGDTIRVRGIIPKGSELTGFWWKTSVSQGSAQFAPGIYTSGTATSVGTLNTEAFVTAAVFDNTTMKRPAMAVGALAASVGTLCLLSDGDLGIVVSVADCIAATWTFTFMFESVEPPGSITTFTG
jgi:hypothetical protein